MGDQLDSISAFTATLVSNVFPFLFKTTNFSCVCKDLYPLDFGTMSLELHHPCGYFRQHLINGWLQKGNIVYLFIWSGLTPPTQFTLLMFDNSRRMNIYSLYRKNTKFWSICFVERSCCVAFFQVGDWWLNCPLAGYIGGACRAFTFSTLTLHQRPRRCQDTADTAPKSIQITLPVLNAFENFHSGGYFTKLYKYWIQNFSPRVKLCTEEKTIHSGGKSFGFRLYCKFFTVFRIFLQFFYQILSKMIFSLRYLRIKAIPW